MRFTELSLKGAFLIEIDLLCDHRGFFGRSWCKNEFEEHGLEIDLAQSNISYNLKKGTLRGMHYQKEPFQETKLVRCTKGAIFDVIVDLRPNSASYRNWFGVELSDSNYKMLYVPKNFAHGYITLQDNSEVMYFVTEMYAPNAEGGIRWDDQSIGITWPLEPLIVSDKDQNHPKLAI